MRYWACFVGQRAAHSPQLMQSKEARATAALFKTYPKLLQCLGCGACTKVCPQDLDVKNYMALAMKGDIAAVARASFDCINCGLCAARCPTEQAQYRIAILCQRIYGRNLAPRSQHLAERVEEVEAGKFNDEMAELRGLSDEELRRRYDSREIVG